MSDIKTIPVTAGGGNLTGLISFAVGETVNINLTCNDPATGLALNLTSSAVILTLAVYDTTGKAIPISRQATITNAAQGLCTVSIVSGDTYVSPTSIAAPGNVLLDLWAEDVSGNRLRLGYGTATITAAVRYPSATVTPLPAQAPLAQSGTWFAAAFDSTQDSVAVTFAGITTNPPKFTQGIYVADALPGGPNIWITNLTNTGCTVNTGARFTGTVNLLVSN